MPMPTFKSLLHAERNEAGNLVMNFLGQDDKRYSMELDAACAALTVAAIVGNMQELRQGSAQIIKVQSVQGAQYDDGSPGLVLGLEGGGELPLQFRAGDLRELVQAVQDIGAPGGKTQH